MMAAVVFGAVWSRLEESAIVQSGILNDLSAQSALPLLDSFSYVFDTDEQEY